MSLIIKAAQLAEKLHRGVPRKYTGQPYITHPCRVAARLMIHPLSNEVNVAAAFLHDVIEDCNCSKEQLYKKLCGNRIDNCYEEASVCELVQWLTNPSKGSSLSRAERKEMDREHLRSAPQIVKIIKMIDRIDNLREMSGADNGFKVKYAAESQLLASTIGDADNELYNELLYEIEKLGQSTIG